MAHIVTLVHRSSNTEKTITVTPASDSFSDLLAEVRYTKEALGWRGVWDIIEILEC